MAWKTAVKAFICFGILAATAACGVRGPMELPPEQKAEVGSRATAAEGQGRPEGGAGKPHRPFILDGLL